MDYLLLGRIAKLVALLGFVLPWVTVSCSGTDILQATGIQLMTGDLQPSEGFAQMAESQGSGQAAQDADPNPFVIAAFAAGVIGLALTFLTKARAAAIVLIVAGLGGAGLAYYSVQDMQASMTREMNQQSGNAPAAENPYMSADQQRDMQRAMASAIQVEEQEGFWVTVIAFALSALLGLLMIAGAGAAGAARELKRGS